MSIVWARKTAFVAGGAGKVGGQMVKSRKQDGGLVIELYTNFFLIKQATHVLQYSSGHRVYSFSVPLQLNMHSKHL